jgi:hypothetical protein
MSQMRASDLRPLEARLAQHHSHCHGRVPTPCRLWVAPAVRMYLTGDIMAVCQYSVDALVRDSFWQNTARGLQGHVAPGFKRTDMGQTASDHRRWIAPEPTLVTKVAAVPGGPLPFPTIVWWYFFVRWCSRADIGGVQALEGVQRVGDGELTRGWRMGISESPLVGPNSLFLHAELA